MKQMNETDALGDHPQTPPGENASPQPSRDDLLIALNATRAMSRAAISRLAEDLEAWLPPDSKSASAPDPARVGLALGVPPEQVQRARAALPNAVEVARLERERAARQGARIITRFDAPYPQPLGDLSLAPPVLYVRGEIPRGPAVAIVGSRRADDYGLDAARYFARHLAGAGVTIVSGFALGVDTAAHQAALAANGGRTVAVLGCGIDVPYPARNTGLGEAIAASGAVLTEFPTGHPPRPWCFPVRNRIIAALSRLTLVAQAAVRSGSLITAHHALDLGRDVYAVPGGIFDDRSLGTNELIRDGAHLAQHARDLLDALRLPTHELLPATSDSQTESPDTPRPATSSGSERPLPQGIAKRLLTELSPGEAMAPDELGRRLGIAAEMLLGELLDLELSGWIERLPGPLYLRR